jgi:hypothetical protein
MAWLPGIPGNHGYGQNSEAYEIGQVADNTLTSGEIQHSESYHKPDNEARYKRRAPGGYCQGQRAE